MKDLKQLKEMFQFTFGSDSGKEVLKDLEARCNYRVSSFVKGDSNGTAYEEGKRSVYLYILNMLEEAKTNE